MSVGCAAKTAADHPRGGHLDGVSPRKLAGSDGAADNGSEQVARPTDTCIPTSLSAPRNIDVVRCPRGGCLEHTDRFPPRGQFDFEAEAFRAIRPAEYCNNLTPHSLVALCPRGGHLDEIQPGNLLAGGVPQTAESAVTFLSTPLRPTTFTYTTMTQLPDEWQIVATGYLAAAS